MNEHIDHEAARDCANEAVEFYANNLLANGYRLSNSEQRDYLVSTAYLDLHAQLAAERARVIVLAGFVCGLNIENYSEAMKGVTAILECNAKETHNG